jgi:hypothetical protein
MLVRLSSRRETERRGKLIRRRTEESAIIRRETEQLAYERLRQYDQIEQ